MSKKQKQTLMDDLQSNVLMDVSDIKRCHTCIHSQSYFNNIGYCEYKNQPVTKLNFCGEHDERPKQTELE
mgnify:CR=1 FL=1